MRPDTPTANEISGIEGALDALLSAATSAKAPERPFRAMSFAEAIAEWSLPATKAERTAAELIRDPVGRALRSAVMALGERLHEIGGLDLMTRVLDDVAERDLPQRSRREAIMDKGWDGIGRSDQSSGWCA